MRIFIKNMVSLRCKMMVQAELDKLQVAYSAIELGEVELNGKLSDAERNKLKLALQSSGLELMDDRNAILIEKIKNVVVEMVHYADELPEINFSEYLSNKLEIPYPKLSAIFSQTKGITIEHYVILQKIEKVKELLIYDELSLGQIADKLHYSSPAHLSNQFKKITGLTPSFFRSLKFQRKQGLEDI